MSTILVVYSAEPKFPAIEQNPAATRHNFGTQWFDVLNGPMTQAEADAYNAALAAEQTAKDAETLRVATFAEDQELTEGLNATKGATAAEIDAYVEQTITLTATDIDALRLEVQTVLRSLARRQFKALFNPTPLIGQLDTAKAQAEKVRNR